ncbi:spliceosome associated protein [Zopfochytrium polystomum]|nr:spliceosome associated protein [Zopfochytrium polystomum]
MPSTDIAAASAAGRADHQHVNGAASLHRPAADPVEGDADPDDADDDGEDLDGVALGGKDGGVASGERDKKKKKRRKKRRAAAVARSSASVAAASASTNGNSADKQHERANAAEVGLENVTVEYVAAPIPELADPTFRDLKHVFDKFTVVDSDTAEGAQDVADDENETETKGATASSAAENGDAKDDDAKDDDDEEDEKGISKKKKRLESRLSVAQLKQLVKRPEVVDWVDVTAADPKLLVHLKAYRNTVPVPIHWQQKRKYLQGKRGVEKPPFDLPDFIKQTGIMEIRNAVKEKEDAARLKAKSRERIQPKMGKLDIDYQKLHDAFFRWQTKPVLSLHGDMYYEGKEFETKLKMKKPGQLSEDLKIALGMPPLAPPPWLINMQRYGPPPSYPGLKIPGLNAPIPEGAHWGFHPGGWGKPPVDEYGRPLYGDVFGLAAPEMPKEAMAEIERSVWGELEPEEEEEYDEADAEEDEDGVGQAPSEYDQDAPPEGLVTPSGLTSVPSGLETPDYIELRKETRRDDGPRELYKVIPQKEASIRGFMGSQHTYDLSGVGQAAPLDSDVSAQLSSSSKKRSRVPGVVGSGDRVELALNPEDLEEGLEGDAVRRAYEDRMRASREEARGEDFSDMVAEHAQRQAKKRKKDEGGSGASGGSSRKDKFKF